MPHLLPCPVDRRAFSDSGPDPSKRRKKSDTARPPNHQDVVDKSADTEESADALSDTRRRECPVPKPGGMIGQIMGFPEKTDRDGAQVIVKPHAHTSVRNKHHDAVR